MSFAPQSPMVTTHGGSLHVTFSPKKTNGTYRNIHPPEVPIIKAVTICHTKPSSLAQTSKRRKQLEDIKSREELKAARHRLRHILLQKLSNKYKRARKIDIGNLLDDLIYSKLALSAADLGDLEEAVKNLDAQERLKGNIGKGNKNASTVNFSESGQNGNPESNDQNEDEYPISRIIRGHEWRMLQAYQFIVDEDIDQRKTEEKKKRELEAKRVLDEQVAARKAAAQREKDLEKEYLSNLVKTLDSAQAKKDEQMRIAKEKNSLANELWLEQLNEKNRRLKEESDDQIRREQALHQAYLMKMQEEREAEMIRKQLEFDKQQKLIQANEEDKRLREQRHQAEIDEDKRMNKAYADKLDREQKARESAFAERMAKLKKFGENVDNGPAMRAKREEEERLEAIRNRDMKAKYDADLQRELNDAANRRNKRLQMEQENLRQMEAKKRIQDLSKSTDNDLAEKFKMDAEEHRRIEKEKRRLAQEARKLYGSRLMRQMNQKSDSQKEVDDMIERERRYNSHNLRNIVDDTKVYDKICGRLKLSLSQKLKVTIASAGKTLSTREV